MIGTRTWIVAALLLASPELQAHHGEPFAGWVAQPQELKPGTWAQYRITVHGGRPAMMLMAALNRVGKAQWFEFTKATNSGEVIFHRLLIEGPITHPKRIVRAIVQFPNARPRLIPPAKARTLLPAFQHRNPRSRGTRVRTQTAAGHVAATRYQLKHGAGQRTLWLSRRVKGWRVVRSHTDAEKIDLVAYGSAGYRAARTALLGR